MGDASSVDTGQSCPCCQGNVVVLACSGASNVGHLADLATRELTRRGIARMGCLAGVAARLPGTLNVVQQARWIVVLDGCGTQCGTRILKEAGFENVLFLRVDALGMKRGETPVNEENVHRLTDAVCQEIGTLCGTTAQDSTDACCR
ncbi:MAG: putative zinc-binding protein [Thermogutta sp.]|nr:putative zinc-binding protein [Thermogutta sp.]HPU06144.1 putative zinc-binding protein [Thermogutta sp.]HPZ82901.1 putative zinc-binding protein [Thermogutta sp.]HQF12663.1 putative zinc-binding protein [Thermogutta sp.]